MHYVQIEQEIGYTSSPTHPWFQTGKDKVKSLIFWNLVLILPDKIVFRNRSSIILHRSHCSVLNIFRISSFIMGSFKNDAAYKIVACKNESIRPDMSLQKRRCLVAGSDVKWDWLFPCKPCCDSRNRRIFVNPTSRLTKIKSVGWITSSFCVRFKQNT